jgi:hypothetical protein
MILVRRKTSLHSDAQVGSQSRGGGAAAGAKEGGTTVARIEQVDPRTATGRARELLEEVTARRKSPLPA